PLHQGFDVDVPHWYGPGPAGSYLAPWSFPPALHFNGEPGEHIEDRMAREASRFIRENRNRPFFLNYWHFSVHSPWEVRGVLQAKPALIEKYRQRVDPNNPQRNPLYAAMVETLDAAVGTLLDTLDETGIADNTIVIFFSDNGGVHFTEVAGAPITSNAPLRGGKATIYEGGIREDCVVVWPGRVQPGSVSHAVIQSIDFYPTLLEMLGLKPQPGQRFDGISIVPVLTQKGTLQRDAIFCHFPHQIPATGAVPAVSVRQGDWKLIRFFHDGPNFTHRYELYHLKEDIGETRNLAAAMPGRVKEMDALIEGFLKESGAVLPRPNPAYNPALIHWSASRDAGVRLEGGLLVIESTGSDPFVHTSDVPALTGEVTVELRLRSAATGMGQVFWGAKGVLPLFFRERSVPLKVEHDGAWHEYTVKLPVQGEMTAFRLDPAAGPGRIEIDWIRLRGADGRVQKEWTFDQP
ncbi:MAG: sulfatase-like hydrolase/transferase, partial [Armatimonadota bacterium]|nr:sulfatase-like hydrolase/transferase [Armatimonadota bacterium]